ncbi:hypothetical protein M2459_001331 [Parabacteroides sp. PF5-5]|uniref:structural protein P5 n=1 Tax=unclassified Parabacteroides TaxID=2649774 RepID=UPI002475D1ED|nr:MULTISPECIES: structural protein P5 [unclassified Parabacteroides]MDH6304596.1 hypothetical protein [Parabacteroides sp. PH5-39]MDH6315791.1 hypothetical protein [Parabacteroides sp. PF5-13]MDH6319450.1 hypothetical protein [Parabacteroides sp. PH5-13]MDH6323181.1 hypothetical protein [Parabacteroides sp. PH5-8]MDH6326983.1 hypothetical protein [Parabacteroides sp. PH5-41]
MSTKGIPRGFRNCNPGNIRINSDKFIGEIVPSQDTSFKQFENMAYGYRAMFRILKNYINNYKLDTIDKIISRWAPANENHTDVYIKTVSAKTGLDAYQKISFSRDVMCNIVYAMAFVENGREPDMADIYAGWNLL